MTYLKRWWWKFESFCEHVWGFMYLSMGGKPKWSDAMPCGAWACRFCGGKYYREPLQLIAGLDDAKNKRTTQVGDITEFLETL